MIHGEIDATNYVIPPYSYRRRIMSFLAKMNTKHNVTFGTCKEGFFDLHSYRCSGLDPNASYLPTIEHILLYLKTRKRITLADAVDLLRKLGADKKYLNRFIRGWYEKKLFIGFPNVSFYDNILALRQNNLY